MQVQDIIEARKIIHELISKANKYENMSNDGRIGDREKPFLNKGSIISYSKRHYCLPSRNTRFYLRYQVLQILFRRKEFSKYDCQSWHHIVSFTKHSFSLYVAVEFLNIIKFFQIATSSRSNKVKIASPFPFLYLRLYTGFQIYEMEEQVEN